MLVLKVVVLVASHSSWGGAPVSCYFLHHSGVGEGGGGGAIGDGTAALSEFFQSGKKGATYHHENCSNAYIFTCGSVKNELQ